MISMTTNEARYLLSILTIFLVSITLPLHNKKILHVPASIIILLIAYNVNDVLLLLSSVIVSYSMIYLFKSKHKKHYVMLYNFIVLLSYKILCKPAAHDISGPLMVQIIKMYYLARDYNQNTTKKSALIYTFLVPGILAGPVASFTEFLSIKEKKSTISGTKNVLKSLIFLILFSQMRAFLTINTILSNERFISRVFLLVAFTIFNRCKYYFAWTFSFGCFQLIGYSFRNVHPLRAEFSTSVKELLGAWNVYTNIWLKDSVFVPLKKFGFFRASFATFFVSALWHGINPNYFLTFLTISVAVPLLNFNSSKVSLRFGVRIGNVFSFLQTCLFIAYCSVAFMVLNLFETVEIWKCVWFYGHFYMILSLPFYLFDRANKKLEAKKMK